VPNELLDQYTPITLTHAVERIKPEALYLSKVLGVKGARFHATEQAVFDVVEGNYKLAPMGRPGDPASVVNLTDSLKSYSIVPPQIFLRDPIKASDIATIRMAGQSPILVGGDPNPVVAAFDDYVARKQRNMVRSIERREEWLWSQALTTGKIAYTNPETGWACPIDFGVPSDNIFTAGTLWGSTADPIQDLQTWARLYASLNGMVPTVFVLGTDAADAFRNNAKVQGWLKSAGAMLLQAQMGASADLVIPIANIPGIGQIVEYAATYPADSTGTATPYIGAKTICITNPALWQLHYGAVVDFDLGENPVAMVRRYSKIKTATDGKSKDLFVEAHPLPVLEKSTGILVVTVAS
jgi:hypothetical protein